MNDKVKAALDELRNQMVAKLNQARLERENLANSLRSKETEIDTLAGAVQGIDASANKAAQTFAQEEKIAAAEAEEPVKLVKKASKGKGD